MRKFKKMVFFYLPMALVVISCQEEPETSVPVVTTSNVTSITATSAQSGGEVTDDGGISVTSRGVCWSTSGSPTTDNSKTSDGIGIGSFTSSLTGLSLNEFYFLRAYATNSDGTAYGQEVTFRVTSSKELGQVTDIENNVYGTVAIGTQTWTVANLKTTKYNDDTDIPLVTDDTEWDNLTTPGYCWYDNDESSYKNTYGALYNWPTVNTGKLCPSGWHVPTKSEWTTLIDYLGGEDIAGGKLKEAGLAHWESPNTGATNESGFLAQATGYRWPVEYGGFIGGGNEYTIIWSATESDEDRAWSLELSSSNSIANLGSGFKVNGVTVRCVKDN